jgi:hypothetical protein
MSYRSDTGWCLSAKAAAQLERVLRDREEMRPMITEFLDRAKKRMDKESGATLYYWERVKWYPDFAEISFIEEFMWDCGHGEYLFIRIGESGDDNDCRGEFWDNPFAMSLERRIVFI